MIIERRFGLRVVAVVTLLGFCLYGGMAMAQSYDPAQTIPKPTLFEKRMNKLGRGITNILFGWTEIPVTWDRKMKEGKPLTYLLGTAPVLGITRAFMRTGTGVYEIFTFRKPHKEVGYEALLEPDYIF